MTQFQHVLGKAQQQANCITGNVRFPVWFYLKPHIQPLFPDRSASYAFVHPGATIEQVKRFVILEMSLGVHVPAYGNKTQLPNQSNQTIVCLTCDLLP